MVFKIGRTDSRVKVKAPKSGSERLELVLDESMIITTEDDARGDTNNYYADTSDAHEREQPAASSNANGMNNNDPNLSMQYIGDELDYYGDGDQYPQSLYRCVSSHSASTAETDNRFTARAEDSLGASLSLTQTWSMASGHSHELPHLNSKVSFADEHIMPSVEEEGRVTPAPLAWQEADLKLAYQHQADARDDDSPQSSNSDGQYYAAPRKGVSFDENSPKNDEEADHSPTKHHLNSSANKNGSFGSDADLASFFSEASATNNSNHVPPTKKKGGWLRKKGSDDTSVESMGWKVMTTWSKGNKQSSPTTASAKEFKEKEAPPTIPEEEPSSPPAPQQQDLENVLQEKPVVPQQQQTSSSKPPSHPITKTAAKKLKGALRVQPRYSHLKKNQENGGSPASTPSSTSSSSPGDGLDENISISSKSSNNGIVAKQQQDDTPVSEQRPESPQPLSAPASKSVTTASIAESAGCSVATEPAAVTKKVQQQQLPTPSKKAAPKRSVSTITRHPSYVRANPGAQSVVSELSNAAALTDSPWSNVATGPSVQGGSSSDDMYENEPPQQQQQRQSTFRHRRTLPRDHPSNAQNTKQRPSLFQSLSNVSATSSAGRSNNALDGYIDPLEELNTNQRRNNRLRSGGLTASGLFKKARGVKENVKKFVRKKTPPKVLTQMNKVNSGNNYTSKIREQKSMDGENTEQLSMLNPGAARNRRMNYMLPEPPMEILSRARKPKKASKQPEKSAPPQFTAYQFEGYDQDVKSPRGGLPSNHNPWAGKEANMPSNKKNKNNVAATISTLTSPHDNNSNPSHSHGTTNTFADNNTNNNMPMSPPKGQYNLQGSGMPSVKWWTWTQPNEDVAEHDQQQQQQEEDSTYFAFMCMFPSAAKQ